MTAAVCCTCSDDFWGSLVQQAWGVPLPLGCDCLFLWWLTAEADTNPDWILQKNKKKQTTNTTSIKDNFRLWNKKKTSNTCTIPLLYTIEKLLYLAILYVCLWFTYLNSYLWEPDQDDEGLHPHAVHGDLEYSEAGVKHSLAGIFAWLLCDSPHASSHHACDPSNLNKVVHGNFLSMNSDQRIALNSACIF